jgi:hypothetical protein
VGEGGNLGQSHSIQKIASHFSDYLASEQKINVLACHDSSLFAAKQVLVVLHHRRGLVLFKTARARCIDVSNPQAWFDARLYTHIIRGLSNHDNC